MDRACAGADRGRGGAGACKGPRGPRVLGHVTGAGRSRGGPARRASRDPTAHPGHIQRSRGGGARLPAGTRRRSLMSRRSSGSSRSSKPRRPFVRSIGTGVLANLDCGRLDEARRHAVLHDEILSRLTPHQVVHGLGVRLLVEERTGSWDVIRAAEGGRARREGERGHPVRSESPHAPHVRVQRRARRRRRRGGTPGGGPPRRSTWRGTGSRSPHRASGSPCFATISGRSSSFSSCRSG